MARRENQGLQIFLIIFILLSLVFMVTTYFGYTASTRLEGERAAMEAERDTANRGIATSESLAAEIRKLAGFDANMTLEDTKSALTDAVKNYGQAIDPENRTLLGIIQHQGTRVADLSGKLALVNEDVKKLRAEMQSAETSFKEQLASAKTREAKAQADFQQAVKEKQDYIAVNDARNKKYIAERDQANTAREKATREAASSVTQAKADVKRKEFVIKTLQDKVNNYESDTLDQYDGQVLGVAAATKSVMINLGSADGLRPKMVFSVYDAGENNVRKAERKATIEVTRVLTEHTALARVLETDYIYPIVRDDYIASPVWSPGQTLGLALVGKIDIDGDGLDDRELVHNLVRRNGGRIDAEEINNKVTGPGISVNTRYIVVGSGQLGAQGLLQQADRLSIERMSVSELVDLLGGNYRVRAVKFDGVERPGILLPDAIPAARFPSL